MIGKGRKNSASRSGGDATAAPRSKHDLDHIGDLDHIVTPN